MANTYPDKEETLEIPSTNNAMLLKACAIIADGHIKNIDQKVKMLAVRLGLQSMASGNITRSNATAKRKSNTCNQVCETEAKVDTYTITELADILEKLPAGSYKAINNFIALQESVATLKIASEKLFSLVDKLQKNKNLPL